MILFIFEQKYFSQILAIVKFNVRNSNNFQSFIDMNLKFDWNLSISNYFKPSKPVIKTMHLFFHNCTFISSYLQTKCISKLCFNKTYIKKLISYKHLKNIKTLHPIIIKTNPHITSKKTKR